MVIPPTQDEWDNAFSKSHELDPAPDYWGLFAYSDAPPPVCGSGLGSFHWFRTQSVLVLTRKDSLSQTTRELCYHPRGLGYWHLV
jgi:hypothetical protein